MNISCVNAKPCNVEPLPCILDKPIIHRSMRAYTKKIYNQINSSHHYVEIVTNTVIKLNFFTSIFTCLDFLKGLVLYRIRRRYLNPNQVMLMGVHHLDRNKFYLISIPSREFSSYCSPRRSKT